VDAWASRQRSCVEALIRRTTSLRLPAETPDVETVGKRVAELVNDIVVLNEKIGFSRPTGIAWRLEAVDIGYRVIVLRDAVNSWEWAAFAILRRLQCAHGMTGTVEIEFCGEPSTILSLRAT
jgi:hypothetical protein